MNKTEFMEGIHKLQNAYNVKFDTEKLKFWYDNLKDLPKEKYMSNIDYQIKTNAFMPNIAQLRNEKLGKIYANYEQRDYSNFDFNKLYAN